MTTRTTDPPVRPGGSAEGATPESERLYAAARAYVAAHGETLQRCGITSLALFGSVARGDAGPESDVDVLYAFAPGQASIAAVLDIQEGIAEAAGRPVQMVSQGHLHPLLEKRILREAQLLFRAAGHVQAS